MPKKKDVDENIDYNIEYDNNTTFKKRKKIIADPDVKRLKVASPHNGLRIGSKQYIFRFDPTELNTDIDGKRIGIVGASGSGKTFLLRELIRISNFF